MLAICDWANRFWSWAQRRPWAAIALLVFVPRLATLINAPLGHDESLYVVQGLDWTQGGLPCVTTWVNKPPTFIAMAWLAYRLLPSAPFTAVHLLTCAAALGVCLGIYEVGKQLAGKRAGLAAALFAILLLNANLAGQISDLLSFETELFQTFFVIVSVWAVIRIRPTWRAWLLAGAAISLAAQMRQNSVLFVMVPMLFGVIVAGRLPPAGGLGLGAGFAAALAPLISFYGALGRLRELFFCLVVIPANLNVNLFSWPALTGGLSQFGTYFSTQALVLLVAVAGLFSRDRALGQGVSSRRLSVMLVVWGVIGCVSISMTGKFFAHYFIQLIPPLALLAGLGYELLFGERVAEPRPGPMASEATSATRGRIANAALLTVVCVLLASAMMYQVNQWVQSRQNPRHSSIWAAGQFLAQVSAPGDRLFVFGRRPELYILAKLRPATPEIAGTLLAAAAHNTPGGATDRLGPQPELNSELITDASALQDYLGHQLEAHPPRYVVNAPFHRATVSWATHSRYPYLERFLRERYRPIHQEGELEIYERVGH